MKKTYIIGIVLAILVLAAGAAAFLLTGTAVDRAEAEHRMVLDTYKTMLENAENTSLTVREDGIVIGSYNLEQLGLLSDATAKINAAFTETERLPAASFTALPAKEKIQWSTEERPATRTVSPDLTNLDLTAILADLDARPRKEAQNAYMEFIDGTFLVHEEIPGTMLRYDVVTASIEAALQGLTVSSVPADSAAAPLLVEITNEDCYLPPEQTVENTFFDFPARLREGLQGVTVTVNFHGQTETLNSDALETILYTDEKGKIQIHEDVLKPIITGWWELYQEKGVSYLFNSYVDGVIPIDFLKVDYEINREDLYEQLSEKLVKLESFSVEPEWYCWKNSEAFSIEGEYIEIDITNQTMTYFKDDEVVVTTPIVSGATWGYPTPEGLYDIDNKDTDIYLSGADYNVHVDYWMGIVGYTIGIHDADWRTKFGGENYVRNGSHGCINTPKEATKIIFDNADIGVPVLVHGK